MYLTITLVGSVTTWTPWFVGPACSQPSSTWVLSKSPRDAKNGPPLALPAAAYQLQVALKLCQQRSRSIDDFHSRIEGEVYPRARRCTMPHQRCMAQDAQTLY